MVLDPEISISLTRGANEILRNRAKELLPETLDLILASNQDDLLNPVVHALSLEQLAESMRTPILRRKIYHQLTDEALEKVHEVLIEILPSLAYSSRDADGNYLDTECGLVRHLLKTDARAWEICAKSSKLAEALIRHEECSLGAQLKILHDYPNLAYDFFSSSLVHKAFKDGTIKVELAPGVDTTLLPKRFTEVKDEDREDASTELL